MKASIYRSLSNQALYVCIPHRHILLRIPGTRNHRNSSTKNKESRLAENLSKLQDGKNQCHLFSMNSLILKNPIFQEKILLFSKQIVVPCVTVSLRMALYQRL